MYRDLGWSRSLLPGITRYVRTYTNWELQLLKVNPNGSDLSNYDGLIGPLFDGSQNETMQEIRKRQIPAVNISGALPPPDFPLVTHDNELVGEMAAEHLMSLGLENFACLTIPKTLVSQHRAESFAAAIQAAGFPAPVEIDLPRGKNAAQIFTRLEKPLGVFAINDRRARHLEQSLRAETKWQIPRDLALLGCDNDFMECELCATPISSVDLDLEEVGYQAASQLDRLFQGKPTEASILIPPKGIARRRSSDYLLHEDTMIRRVLDQLRNNYQEKLSPGDLAREQGLTPRHVQRRFKAATGKTLQQALQEIRLDKARKLLSETPLSISEIAMETGFSDINRFPGYFRKRYGCTPRAYRRNLSEDKDHGKEGNCERA